MPPVSAAALEILNIALSIVSLATRFVASILNFGYVSTSVQGEGWHYNGAEMVDLSAIKRHAEIDDYCQHAVAFNLI